MGCPLFWFNPVQSYALDAVAPDVVVATTGNDTAAGTINAPFATLDARQAVRTLLTRQPNRHTPILVQIRGGTYFLDAPVTFTAQDSGTADAPVIYENWRGETPVISGGVPLHSFTADASGHWV